MTPHDMAQEVRQRCESAGMTLAQFRQLISELMAYERIVWEAPVTGERLAQQRDELLDTREIAEYLGVSLSSVYTAIRAHKLPARQVFGQWRATRAALDEWWPRHQHYVEKARRRS